MENEEINTEQAKIKFVLYLKEQIKKLSKENKKLKAKNEALKYDYRKVLERELLLNEENESLKNRIKELNKQANCYHHNEKMHQGDGYVYVTCKDCGSDL